MTEDKEKPPVGLKPRYIHEMERALDITAAIERRLLKGMKVPAGWVKELYNLVVRNQEGSK